MRNNYGLFSIKSHFLSLSLLFISVLVSISAAGCAEDTLLAPDAKEVEATNGAEEYAALKAQMNALKADLESRIAAPGKTDNVVVVPDGSADALAQAIADAGTGGTVVLASGMHTESETVLITQQVTIVGEEDAVLKVNTDVAEGAAYALTPDGAALHVWGTSNAVIWGVEIRPYDPVGGVAILVEDAPGTVVGENGLYDHQFGIIIQGGDHSQIWDNTVVTTSPSPALHPFTPQGIVAAAGSHVQIAGNDVSNAITGIFVGEDKGLLAENESHGNFIGVVFCNFSPPMPGPGGAIEAEFSATEWVAHHNDAHDNSFVGYFVYDGANNNLITNNAASNNGVFDIILTAVTPRDGLPDAPATFENHVVAGSFNDITIQDCGNDNKVDGGVQIDC